jgi:hypothetical protein
MAANALELLCPIHMCSGCIENYIQIKKNAQIYSWHDFR